MNYTGKIDLTKLNGAALVAEKEGKLYLLIEIEPSGLVVNTETGAVYLDLVMWESRNNAEMHYIKQQISKEKQQELKQLPKDEHYKAHLILGNLHQMPLGSKTENAEA